MKVPVNNANNFDQMHQKAPFPATQSGSHSKSVPESGATLSSASPQLSVLAPGPRVGASAKGLDEGKTHKERSCAWGRGGNSEEKKDFFSLES